MSAVEVIVDVGTLTPGRLGPTTGAIWVKVDGRDFPVHGWRDFPEVILAWWLTALHGLVTGTAREALLRFMDGPLECTVTQAGDGWTLALFDRDLRSARVATHRVSPKKLCLQVLIAASAVANAVRGRGLVTRDSPGLSCSATITSPQ